MDDSHYVVATGFRIEANAAGTAVRITYADSAPPGVECFAVAGDARQVARRIRWGHRLRWLLRLGLCGLVAGAVVVSLTTGRALEETWLAVTFGAGAGMCVYTLAGPASKRPVLGGVGVAIPPGLFDRLEPRERDALMRLQHKPVDVQLAAGRMVLGDYEQADRRQRLEGQQQAREVARRLLYGQD